MMDPHEIRAQLEARLPECTALVFDDAGDGQHFRAQVTSSAFAGRPRVAQHRMVYEALGALMHGPIHALALTTFTPDRWAARER